MYGMVKTAKDYSALKISNTRWIGAATLSFGIMSVVFSLPDRVDEAMNL